MAPARGTVLVIAAIVAFAAASSAVDAPKTDVSQLHLAQGKDPTEMVVSWASSTPSEGAGVKFFAGNDSSRAVIVKAETVRYSSWCSGSRVPGTPYNYTSPYLKHATLSALAPSTQYSYMIVGEARVDFKTEESAGWHTFRTLPFSRSADTYPFVAGAIGDMGQTSDSLATLDNLMRDRELQIILHAGDMSYADCVQQRWDSWAEMVSPLAASIPWMVAAGNHEVEKDAMNNVTFAAYKARFRMPEAAPTDDTTTPDQVQAAKGCTPSVYVGNYDFGNSYYSFSAGPLFVVVLNTYSDASKGSKQRNWLEQTLTSYRMRQDRAQTPEWLVVVMHGPWYNSNVAHQDESNTVAMKESMETLLVEARAAIVISGHVHAFERSVPVAFERPNAAGPVYINTGDAGNREGLARDYISPAPQWSAHRDGLHFGHSRISFANATHALFQHFSNTDRTGTDSSGRLTVGDSAWILNPATVAA